MSNSTKMFLTWQMVYFCLTPAGVNQAYSDGFSINKNCEWLLAIEPPKICDAPIGLALEQKQDYPTFLMKNTAHQQWTDDITLLKVKSEQCEIS